jgi:hypothetical protein
LGIRFRERLILSLSILKTKRILGIQHFSFIRYIVFLGHVVSTSFKEKLTPLILIFTQQIVWNQDTFLQPANMLKNVLSQQSPPWHVRCLAWFTSFLYKHLERVFYFHCFYILNYHLYLSTIKFKCYLASIIPFH